MNTIYNTYKASEGEWNDKFVYTNLLTTKTTIRYLKSFNRTSALALLESVREMVEKIKSTMPHKACTGGGAEMCDNCVCKGWHNDLVDGLLLDIEQAEQLIKQ